MRLYAGVFWAPLENIGENDDRFAYVLTYSVLRN